MEFGIKYLIDARKTMNNAPHITEAVESTLNAINAGKEKILLHMATGTGKLRVLLEIIHILINKKHSILIVVDLLVMEQQLYDLLEAQKIEVSRISSNEIFLNFSQILICTVQKLDDVRLESYDYVFAYEIIGTPLVKLYNRFEKLIAFVSNADNKTNDLFSEVVFSYSAVQAIIDGYANPIRLIVPDRKIHIEDIDGIKKAINLFMEEFATDSNRKAIIYCRSISDCDVVENILKQKYGSEDIVVIHSNLSNQIRQEAINRFVRDEQIRIAINVEMLLSGIDIPSLTDVVLLRRFKQVHLFEQTVSRLSRISPGKKVANVWDFADNSQYYNQCEYLNVDEIVPLVLEQKRVVPVGDQVADKDLLGRRRLTHALKGILESTTNFRPFVIGLLGKWGTGKSTTIQLLEKEFEDKSHTKFIFFNAWQNEHCQHMGAALAHTIVNVLYQKKSIFKQMLLSFKYQFFLNKETVAQSWVLLLSLFGLAIIVVDQVDITRQVPLLESKTLELNVIMIFLLATSSMVWSYWKHPFSTKIRVLAKRPNYSEHLGIAQQFKDELEALFQSLESNFLLIRKWLPIVKKTVDNKYIIIVDDLDRCSDKKILEVLEAIRLITDHPAVIVVLSVDKTILLNAIANRYRAENKEMKPDEAQQQARNFLGKILQVSVELETPSNGNIRQFVSEKLFARNEAIQEKTTKEVRFEDAFKVENENKIDELNYVEEEMFTESDDYLTTTHDEEKFFLQSVETFKIDNPRTLIRLHNTISMLKGVFPALNYEFDELKKYIFMTFLMEFYDAASLEVRSEFNEFFTDKNGQIKSNSIIRQIFDGMKDVSLLESVNNSVKLIYDRVRQFSLPSNDESSLYGIICQQPNNLGKYHEE